MAPLTNVFAARIVLSAVVSVTTAWVVSLNCSRVLMV